MSIQSPQLLIVVACLLAGACASSGAPAPITGPMREERARVQLPAPPAVLPGVDAGGLLGAAPVGARVDPSADLGLGLLRLSGGYEAWRTVDLPLFDAPGGRQWGWLTRGRAYDAGSDTATPERPGALVVSGEDTPAFLVLARAGAPHEGWVRIRWGLESDPRGGMAWTYPGLARGAIAQAVTWERMFEGASGLIFRNPGSAHNLRAGPGTDQRIVRTLSGAGYDLSIVRIAGDWAEVDAHEPALCAGAKADAEGLLGGASGALAGGRADGARVTRGWVRWKSPEKGPWVMMTPGGCRRQVS